jgi:hypothetical protein
MDASCPSHSRRPSMPLGQRRALHQQTKRSCAAHGLDGRGATGNRDRSSTGARRGVVVVWIGRTVARRALRHGRSGLSGRVEGADHGGKDAPNGAAAGGRIAWMGGRRSREAVRRVLGKQRRDERCFGQYVRQATFDERVSTSRCRRERFDQPGSMSGRGRLRVRGAKRGGFATHVVRLLPLVRRASALEFLRPVGCFRVAAVA